MPKHLPVVRDFALYFIRKGQRDLKVKKADYKTASVEYSTRGMVYVWFFFADGTASHISYHADGSKNE